MSSNSASIYWLVLWFLFNICTTLANKLIFDDFPFPTLVSAIHMAFTAIFAHISLKFIDTSPMTPDNQKGNGDQAKTTLKYCIMLFLYSTVFATNIVLGNTALFYATVHTVQVIRSIIPGLTMGMSYFMFQKQLFDASNVASVVMVCFGVAVSCFGDVHFTWIGFFMSLLAAFASAFKSVMTSMFLQLHKDQHPLASLEVACFISLPLMLICSIFTGEFSLLRYNYQNFISLRKIMVLCVNGVLAFLLNFSNLMLTKHTSALTVTISGNVKHVMTIVLSVAFFKVHVTFLNWTGILITLVGAAWYSMLDHNKKTGTHKENVQKINKL